MGRWDAATQSYEIFPVKPAQRAASIATLVVVMALLIASLFHIFHRTVETHGPNQQWSVVDAPYLLGMIALAALLVIHAGLQEEAMLPRTLVTITCILAVPAGLLMFLIVIAWSIAQEQGATTAWIDAAAVGQLVTAILPFALPFTSGVILWRHDTETAKFRVRAVSLAVAIAAAVVLIAAGLPWIVHAVAGGTA